MKPRFQTPTFVSIHQYTVYYSIQYTQCLETPGVSLAADAEKTSGRLASQVTFRNERHAHLTGHPDGQASFRAQMQDEVDPNVVCVFLEELWRSLHRIHQQCSTMFGYGHAIIDGERGDEASSRKGTSPGPPNSTILPNQSKTY